MQHWRRAAFTPKVRKNVAAKCSPHIFLSKIVFASSVLNFLGAVVFLLLISRNIWCSRNRDRAACVLYTIRSVSTKEAPPLPARTPHVPSEYVLHQHAQRAFSKLPQDPLAKYAAIAPAG